jgi:hypothetical protein
MRYKDLLKGAAALVDPEAPPLVLPNPGLVPAIGNHVFPILPPVKNMTLDDILLGHGETKESD